MFTVFVESIHLHPIGLKEIFALNGIKCHLFFLYFDPCVIILAATSNKRKLRISLCRTLPRTRLNEITEKNNDKIVLILLMTKN